MTQRSRRVLVALAAGVAAFALTWGVGWALGGCTSCATGTRPTPPALLAGIVAGLAVLFGERP